MSLSQERGLMRAALGAVALAMLMLLGSAVLGGCSSASSSQGFSLYPDGTLKEVHDNVIYSRGLSWWGQGATEAMTQHQGMKVDLPTPKKPGAIQFSGNKGTGVFERAWSWLSATFWTTIAIALLILLALVAMLFIPATAGVAGNILRWLASLIPVAGSAIERIVASFQVKKAVAAATDGSATPPAAGAPGAPAAAPPDSSSVGEPAPLAPTEPAPAGT